MTAVNIPSNIDAERVVISAAMSGSENLDTVLGALRPDDMFAEAHKTILTAIARMNAEGQPVDPLTLRDAVRGDTPALAALDDIPKRYHVDYNVGGAVDIVSREAQRRRLITIGEQIVDAASSGKDIRDAREIAERGILEITQRSTKKNFESVGSVLPETVQSLRDAETNGGDGIPTGINAVDRIISGMGPGQIIIVGGRPGTGKTSFAQSVALNVAMAGRKVCVFSMEMSTVDLNKRFLSMYTGVDSDRMKKGTMTAADWAAITRRSETFSDLPLMIDESPDITPSEMKSKILEDGGADLVVIDYVQLMHLPGYGGNTRVQELSQITRELKLMARSVNAPVIVLSQLSRELEKRQDKRPLLSDLKDSGSLEQDADKVIFLHRDEMDLTGGTVCEVIVAKQRNGILGECEIAFIPGQTRFADIEYRDWSDLNV